MRKSKILNLMVMGLIFVAVFAGAMSCIEGKALASSMAATKFPLYVTQFDIGVISKIDSQGNVTTFAIGLSGPHHLAFDNNGVFYVSESSGGKISKVDSNGNVITFVSGLLNPLGMVFDHSNTLYVAEYGRDRIVKIDGNGNVSSFATGITRPVSLRYDSNGQLFLTNHGYYGDTWISKVDSNGNITLFATQNLSYPHSMVFNSNGIMYVDEQFSGELSRVDSSGNVQTFATGFQNPHSMAIDNNGNIYVANRYGTTVSKVDSNGNVITFASGLNSPTGLVFTLVLNQPPIANAGENITIRTEEVATTIIHGIATDNDPGDVLTCRWKEGEAVLLDWTPAGENGKCPLALNTISISIGTHTLTMEVTDGKATSSDEMILTIDNTTPHAAPTGGGVYEINTEVTMGGNVSDFDGDLLSYKWIEGTEVLFSGTIQAIAGGTPVELPAYITSHLSLGNHTINLQVDDGVNAPVGGQIEVEIVDTTIPTLAPIPNQTILWPPDHKMVDIVIRANALDNSGLPVLLTAIVTSNEPAEGLGDGDMALDWTEPIIDQNTGTINLKLRAERSGSGNGRAYTIIITATDNSGNNSSASVVIIVPHDKSKN